MVARKKKAAKKTETKKGPSVPTGFRPVSGASTDTWDPANNPDHPRELIGVWGKTRTVNIRRGRGSQEQKMTTIETNDGTVWTVWQSSFLIPLFEEAEKGDTVYIRFDGLGTAKPGESPPKHFTTGIAENDKPF